MNILIVSASLPYPPQQGGALRTFGLLHGLHKAGHSLTLLSFDDTHLDAASTPLGTLCTHIETLPPPVRSKTDRLRDLLTSRQADIAGRMYSPAFHERLRTIVESNPFDLVQFEGIEVACYLPLVRQMRTRAKLCYDAFNAEAALQRVIFEVDRGNIRRLPAALYSFIQIGRIQRFEQTLSQQSDLVVAVSNEDAAELVRYRPDRPVPVVANGIFCDDYTQSTTQLDLGQNAIVFTGKMDYRPNVDAMMWFAEEILPLVRAEIPAARLVVVGQKPHPRLEALRDHEHIEITGWVKDVQPFLRGASVYVAPLRMGSGTRLKILEAMASGCAVVATSIAASGIAPEALTSMRIANTPATLAGQITSLLRDAAACRALGTAAQSLVRTHYDWSVLIPQMLNAYQGIGLG